MILRPHESANDAVGHNECLPYFLRHSAVRAAAAKKIGNTIDMPKYFIKKIATGNIQN